MMRDSYKYCCSELIEDAALEVAGSTTSTALVLGDMVLVLAVAERCLSRAMLACYMPGPTNTIGKHCTTLHFSIGSVQVC